MRASVVVPLLVVAVAAGGYRVWTTSNPVHSWLAERIGPLLAAESVLTGKAKAVAPTRTRSASSSRG